MYNGYSLLLTKVGLFVSIPERSIVLEEAVLAVALLRALLDDTIRYQRRPSTTVRESRCHT